MIPYFGVTSVPILGIPFQTWGTFVAAGFLLGTWIATQRAVKYGLDPKKITDLAFWIFLAAFLGARIFHVLFYDPAHYLAHPWEALDPRKPGFAMFGGFLGAGAAFWWYVRKHALDVLAYADTLIWGLPWGCGVGRIGCFLIHDHPGTLTSFWLGVRYPDGEVRHDLGLYLSIIGFLTGIAFLVLNRRPRAKGYWFGVYMLIEGTTRFSLDFLRVVDVRYAGLTPTQWLSIPLFLAGVLLIRRGFVLHSR